MKVLYVYVCGYGCMSWMYVMDVCTCSAVLWVLVGWRFAW